MVWSVVVGFSLVDFKFLRRRSMWPLAVAMDCGGYFRRDAKVKPGIVGK